MDESNICNCPLCGGEFTPEAGQTDDEHLASGIVSAYKEMQDKSGGVPLSCPRCGCICEDGVSSKCADVLICTDCAIDEVSGEGSLPLTRWRVVLQLLEMFNKNDRSV